RHGSRRPDCHRLFHSPDWWIGNVMKDYWTKHDGFLGKGWAFPPAFDLDEKIVAMATREDDIRENLYLLLTTIPGERIMLPEYGCLIHQHVFDIMGETLFTHLRGMIEHAVLHFEPRIILENVFFTVADQGEGRLQITLEYRIIQTNTRNNLV